MLLLQVDADIDKICSHFLHFYISVISEDSTHKISDPFRNAQPLNSNIYPVQCAQPEHYRLRTQPVVIPIRELHSVVMRGVCNCDLFYISLLLLATEQQSNIAS